MSKAVEVDCLHSRGACRPYLFRAKKRTAQMRLHGGEDWIGCKCPIVWNEDDEALGLLTVCPPHLVRECAGCTQGAHDHAPFQGQSALVDALRQYVIEGWAELDVEDAAGDRCARVDLSSIADALRAGQMPERITAVALPASCVPRGGRIAIAIVASILLLIASSFALVPAFGALIPLALLMLPCFAMLLPAMAQVMRAMTEAPSHGFVTEVPFGSAAEQTARVAVRVPLHDVASEVVSDGPRVERTQVRMRVAISSVPPPTSSGVFPVVTDEVVEEPLPPAAPRVA